MKCKEFNRRGAPCGNNAIEGEHYCQAHLKRRTSRFRRLSSPMYWVPILIGLIGLLADAMGIWSFRNGWTNQTVLKAGIEFIEGELVGGKECGAGDCGTASAGVTYDSEYEPIFHMIAGSEAGECLALGFSLLNNSDILVRNIRAQVSLNNERGGMLEFCDEFDVRVISNFPSDVIKRKFSRRPGASIASYTIEEIRPRSVGFFTLPIRNNPNLRLVSDGEYLNLRGAPALLTVRHSAEKSLAGSISAMLYLSDMADKAQGLTDHALLLGHHVQYSDAVFSDETSGFLNYVKSWFSSRPDYTEHVIGAYDSISQQGLNSSYSLPVEPIVKQVVTVREITKGRPGRMKVEEYIANKHHFCITIVKKVEGETYLCDGKPILSDD